MGTIELEVKGMTCGSCVASVTRALRRVPGVEIVDADLRSGLARVKGSPSVAATMLMLALADAGYDSRLSSKADGGHATDPSADDKVPKQGGCCCGQQ
jgi:copper chaperone CopZ